MAAGDIVWATGFEGNAKNQLDSVLGGGGTLSTAQTKSGSYSFVADFTNRTYVDIDGPLLNTPTQCVVTFWFYIIASPGSPLSGVPYPALAAFLGGGGYSFVCLDQSNNVLIRLESGTSATIATGLSAGTWHYVEMGIDCQTTTVKFKARVNGGASQELTRVVGTQSPVSTLYLGEVFYSFQGGSVYIDDVTAIEGYTYPTSRYTLKSITPNADVSGAYTITGGSATRAAALADVATEATANSTYIGSSTNAGVQVLDLSTYTLQAGESFKAITLVARTGSTATTARSITARFQNAAGTNFTQTSVWDCAFNGFWGGSGNATAVAASGPVNKLITHTNQAGGALTQSDVNGLRLSLTKSSDTRLCNVSNVWGYAVIAVAAPLSQTLSATLSFTSGQTRKALDSLTAVLSFAGSISAVTVLLAIQQALTASLSFTSAQTKKVLEAQTAALSFTSAQTKKVLPAILAALSFSGAVSQKVARALAAALSFSSSKTITAKDAISAALSFTSSGVRLPKSAFGAALSFTSAQSRVARNLISAALSFSSNLALAAKLALAATLTFSGSAVVSAFKSSLTAALSFSSSGTRGVKSSVSAALSFTSEQTKKTATAISAALGFNGNQFWGVKKSISAALSFSSTKAVGLKKALAAAVSFTSAQSKLVRQQASAALSFAGVASTFGAVRQAFTATLSFTSAQTKRLSKPLTAALNFTVSRATEAKRLLSAALSPTGAIQAGNKLYRAFTATLSFTSSSTKRLRKAISASLRFAAKGPLPIRGFAAFVTGRARATDGSVTGNNRGSAGSVGPGDRRNS